MASGSALPEPWHMPRMLKKVPLSLIPYCTFFPPPPSFRYPSALTSFVSYLLHHQTPDPLSFSIPPSTMTCPAGFTFDSLPQKAPYAEMTETLEPGMQIDYFGSTFTWTDNHLPASRLEPLRRVGDELADNALEALKIKSGEDAYKALLAYVSRPEHEQKSPAPGLLMKQLMTIPEWVDWDQVARGQQVFW